MSGFLKLRELVLWYQKQYDLSVEEAVKAIRKDLRDMARDNSFIYEEVKV